ncbi:MAG: nucleoside-diphosphate-sugar epimerase [Planctomycetota bacterium]|jgi:nucleoside-diphosphate-sugar epimerase
MSETYFLTGALGCIGAWVTKTVLDQGDTPVVFDLGGDSRRLAAILDPEQLDRVQFVQGDISDGDTVSQAMEAAGTTRVIHLAGLQVPFCKTNPAAGARVNVLGTINVFEAARAMNLERVVYASSAAVYGPPVEERAPDERDACEPTTHYGVFKRANEGNARIYYQDCGLSSVGIRPLTVYGVGRDQGMTSGPTVAMKAAALGRPYTIGFGGSTDFNYVGDTAAAFVACAERAPAGAFVFNLHGDSVPVARIVETLKALRPEAAAGIAFQGGELPIPPALDGSALEQAVPGLPHTDLEDGIRWTVERFEQLAAAGKLDTRELDS